MHKTSAMIACPRCRLAAAPDPVIFAVECIVPREAAKKFFRAPCPKRLQGRLGLRLPRRGLPAANSANIVVYPLRELNARGRYGFRINTYSMFRATNITGNMCDVKRGKVKINASAFARAAKTAAYN
jgi:hypothetical protein